MQMFRMARVRDSRSGSDASWAAADPVAARLATISKRAKAARLRTKYYTPEVHVGAFALPQFVRQHVK